MEADEDGVVGRDSEKKTGRKKKAPRLNLKISTRVSLGHFPANKNTPQLRMALPQFFKVVSKFAADSARNLPETSQ